MSKKTFLTFGLLLLMILLLCFPNLCLQAAQNGLLLWFNKVLPSLLPFIIFINILVPLDGLHSFINWCTPIIKRLWHLPGESLFAFLMGLIAGYPMGAKMIKNLCSDHKLSLIEAEYTLCFCNNCSPLFIIGTVGTSMLHQPQLGYFLCFIHLLSACLMSFLATRHFSPVTPTQPHQELTATPPNFFKLLNLAVMNAMDTIVCVGGYIIFFSVILALLTQTPFAQAILTQISSNSNTYLTITGILSSSLELSNGTHTLSHLPISIYSLALIAFAIGFGGICVYFQALFVLDDLPLNTKRFFIAKCIQGCLSFSLTLLLFPLYIKFFQPELISNLYTSKTNYIPMSIFFFIISLIASHLLFHPYSTQAKLHSNLKHQHTS